MTTDLQHAKTLPEDHNYTCVLCKGEQIYTSTKSGVKPLLELLDSPGNFNGFSAADKIVGKAAAMLYVLLGVKEVYAQVLSRAGNVVNLPKTPSIEMATGSALRNKRFRKLTSRACSDCPQAQQFS